MTGRWARWLASLAHRPRAGAPARLVIVRHHRVYADGERPLYRLGVSQSLFEAQLAWLARAGLTPRTVSEGIARLAAGTPGVHVAMSFDDGYADNVERALPALERHGARATFFLAAGMIDERRAPWWDRLASAIAGATLPRPAAAGLPAIVTDADRRVALAHGLAALRLAPEAQEPALAAMERALGAGSPAPCELGTWEQLARLRDAGMEIGAHTLTHPFLSLLSHERQREEIAGSIERIAARLGTRVEGFAYPGGDHDGATLKVAAACGLAWAVTTRAGDNRADTPRFELRRRGLSEGACLDPGGRFSPRLARAELDGAFDRLRRVEAVA